MNCDLEHKPRNVFKDHQVYFNPMSLDVHIRIARHTKFQSIQNDYKKGSMFESLATL